MLHFVIKDANPTILEKGEELVKILNDTVLLISAANGPILNKTIYKKETDKISFQQSESNYEASFQGAMISDKMTSGKFLLSEDGALIMELAFTVNQDKESDVRVKLNCEGEGLVRQELERAFERDFSYDSEQYMKKDLDTSNEKIGDGIASELEDDTEVVESSNADFTFELTELTPELLDDLGRPKILLERFNSIVHDMSRGAVGDFSYNPIGSEVIENGANIQFLDYENEDYIVTFRLGDLDGELEVSFFLEEFDELIFSVHLSSQDHGTIVAKDAFSAQRIERLLS